MKLHDSTDASQAPVLKIGAVVMCSAFCSPPEGEPMRYLKAAVGGMKQQCNPPTDVHKAHPAPPQGGSKTNPLSGNNYDILIIRPKPKMAGEVPPFVLPRGSRQYQDADGSWHDARDKETGARYADRLEPFSRALAREVEEEAGVSAAMLSRAQVLELGAMAFTSRTKGVYPIHWFMVMPKPADATLLGHELPEDAMEMKWASLDEINAMAVTGEFSAGYVPVIEAALARANGAA